MRLIEEEETFFFNQSQTRIASNDFKVITFVIHLRQVGVFWFPLLIQQILVMLLKYVCENSVASNNRQDAVVAVIVCS